MSSNEIAIKVEGLSKCYEIYGHPGDRLKQFIFPYLTRAFGLESEKYFREFWALRDISFEVARGETVGIIGRNGSGKSTLLQLICGTLSPTAGLIETNGRIAALLELGAGFNGEFTGAENIYSGSALLGLSRGEIDARYEDILAFADIGDFIDQPVKTYSSGMFVRLAFAVNIMSQPEIMIVDEALAVGDMAFQAKCMTALKRIQNNGASILFVSHDIGSVKSLCNKALYLNGGKLCMSGEASRVAECYQQVMREEMNLQNVGEDPITEKIKIHYVVPTTQEHAIKFIESENFSQSVSQFRYGKGGARITYAEMINESGEPVQSIEFNDYVTVRIYYRVEVDCILSANYYIQDNKKNVILGANPLNLGEALLDAKKNTEYLTAYKTALPLQEGNYSIHLELTSPVVLDESAIFRDVIDDAIIFNVQRRKSGRLWAKIYLENTMTTVEFK